LFHVQAELLTPLLIVWLNASGRIGERWTLPKAL